MLRVGLLALCIAVFIGIPLRIISNGYFPLDDALRHTAFAVDNRNWSEVILVHPEFRADMDSHPGWHALLRTVHQVTGWRPDQLVTFSIFAAFWSFTLGGLIASGCAPAWLLALAMAGVIDPMIFQALMLGRPLAFSMTALAILLFLWTRTQEIGWRREALVVWAVLSVNIAVHPSAFYLWAIVFPALLYCRRFRSALILLIALLGAIATAAALFGWYNTVEAPLMTLRLALLDGETYSEHLVTELQPSGGPVIPLLVVALIVAVNHFRGISFRSETRQVDFCLMLGAWLLGLMTARFYGEWALPAMAVWLTRQAREGLKIGPGGLPGVVDTLAVFAVAAVALYLGQTANVRGRYHAPYDNYWLTAPEAWILPALPEPGGILYSATNKEFYSLYHRFPKATFRYSTAFAPGIMPPEDRRIMSQMQAFGLLQIAKPWFDRMTPKDRIIVTASKKPEWPGMEFQQRVGTDWIGRKIGP